MAHCCPLQGVQRLLQLRQVLVVLAQFLLVYVAQEMRVAVQAAL